MATHQQSTSPRALHPQQPQGLQFSDFSVSIVPRHEHVCFRVLRPLLDGLGFPRPPTTYRTQWQITGKVSLLADTSDVIQTSDRAQPLTIQLRGRLSEASALHIMDKHRVIVDSAKPLGDGSWTFEDTRTHYNRAAFLLIQTGTGKNVQNYCLALDSLKCG